MYSTYDINHEYAEDPFYKRAAYYLVLFMIGFLPGLITGYVLWH